MAVGAGGAGGSGAGGSGAGGAYVGGTGGAAIRPDGTGGDVVAADPCPAPFACQVDPLLGALYYCAEPGPLPLPPGCTTDADCAAAGLPEATCVAEDETGLNGCLQTCM